MLVESVTGFTEDSATAELTSCIDDESERTAALTMRVKADGIAIFMLKRVSRRGYGPALMTSVFTENDKFKI